MSVTATRLQRVRVRCDGLDPTTARLRLGQLLASAELRPPGLPPAALLCVRRLTDPRPGTLAMGGGQVRPPPEWQRAFVAALERMMREAVRPARGPVPAGAEAVLFADRAELLACLARDICDGTAWVNWWWRGMLDTAVWIRADHVVQRLLEEPEHVPAALELLAAWGSAVRFAQTVAPAVALQLAARVAGAFAAPDLSTALAAPRPVAEDSSPLADEALEQALPGVRFAPEATAPALLPEQALMVCTGLALRRAPAVARSRAFAEEVRRWRAAGAVGDAVAVAHVAPPTRAQPTRAAEPQPTPPRRDPAPSRARGAAAGMAAPQPDPVADQARDVGKPTVVVEKADSRSHPRTPAHHVAADTPLTRDPTTRAAPTRPAVTEERDAAAPPTVDHAPPERSERSSATPPPGDRPRAAAAPRLRAPAESKVVPITRAPPGRPESARVDTGDLALEVQTDLGGLFYLLNLALALELYGDFTAPLEPGIRLNPWELVDLLGAWLLGRRPDDPIWALLASLAGRDPGQPYGRGFRPSRAWRVPLEWLEPFEHGGTWRWSAAAGVLRIVHPAGFAVTAVPRTTAAPEAQLRRELRRLRPLMSVAVRTSLRREPSRPLARWIARLGAYADARLRVALALAADTRVGPVLLEHRARVLVSPSHVDVVLKLPELPLEVRIAGLDRNPGWIPAAGRHVALHFA